jgi:YD repeat-containing protein
LSQVTNPDLTTLTFQYDSNSNITAVLDSNNKVLESHTYDSSQRGLTSARANGVEALTISYHWFSKERWSFRSWLLEDFQCEDIPEFWSL